MPSSMLKQVLYEAEKRKWLFVGLLTGGLIALLPHPSGLSPEGLRVLAIAACTSIFIITEPVPLPTVALMIAVFQVLLDVGTPSNVARTFMSDSVFFIMGSLMLAVAIVKQNLDKRLALGIIALTGSRLSSICFGIVCVSALLASLIGEHTVAAIMLPVGTSLIRLTSEDDRKTRPLAAVIMFCIGYGCSIAGIGTPSGGARNAIMLEYFRSLFGVKVSYFRWMVYAYPMVLIQIPVLTYILLGTFRTETTNLDQSVYLLRQQVSREGKMKRSDWLTVGIFLFTLLLWITSSSYIGMGIIALAGVILYLCTGIIRWEDINAGVNWGVVLLYAASISMGVSMNETGAAAWLAEQLLAGMGFLGLDSGLPLLILIVILTTAVSNTMSPGPAVAILGPIFLDMARISGSNLLVAGFATAIASSFGYMTVVGSPARTIIYGSGYLQTSDYWKAGWKMTLASILIVLLMAKLYWPFLG